MQYHLYYDEYIGKDVIAAKKVTLKEATDDSRAIELCKEFARGLNDQYRSWSKVYVIIRVVARLEAGREVPIQF